MLFITNREPTGPIQGGDEYQFNLEKNAPSNSVYYCQRNGENTYSELGSQAFMQQISSGTEDQVLFYIHGFSNLPEPDIFPRAEKLQSLLNAQSDGEQKVRVIPLIWPCDNDVGIVKDYWDDQKSADQSGASMARVLQKFMAWRVAVPEDKPCLKRMNILAHSMGNRVLRESIRSWNKYDLASGVPMLFRNIFLVAADVVNETLEYGQPGELICHATRNVTVYHASDDFALRSSKISNLKNKIASRRLGHTGPENMENAPNNIYAIDCDDFNNSYDYPKGHSYFLDDSDGNPGRVFQHIYQSLKSGRVDVGASDQRRLILKK